MIWRMRLLLPLAFLLGMLVACQSALVTDLITQPGDVIYQDDFSIFSGSWTRASSTVGAMDYFEGVFRIQVNSTDYDLWSVTGKEFRDVRLEVDAGRYAGPDENRYGLICRYRDAHNFYFFIISSDGYYAIGKTRDGLPNLLGQAMMAYSPIILTGIGPNHLRVDCAGDWLTFYVNNQPVAVVQDADFPYGDVGVLAGAFDIPGVDIFFDNFVVIKP